MIRRTGPWAVLDVSPTDDVSAIRRAYARRLKTIDMDRDPANFIALREARDEILARIGAGMVVEQVPPIVAAPSDHADQQLRPLVADIASLATPVLDLPQPTAADQPVSVHGRTHAETAHWVVSDARIASEPAANPLRGDPSVWEAPRLTLDTALATVTSPASVTEAHYQAIWTLLFPEADASDMSDTLMREQVAPHFQAIVDDPRMAEITIYDNAEQWFAEVLARSCPRSDPLIEAVATHFGWMEHADTVGQPKAITFLTDRIQLLRIYDELRSGRHRLSPAWRELTKPAGEHSLRGMGVSRKNVRELLSLVRTRYPDLEGQFDWYRIQMWETSGTVPKSYRGHIILAMLLLHLILAYARYSDSTGPRVSPAPSPSEWTDQTTSAPGATPNDALTTPQTDIDYSLKPALGPSVTFAEVRRKNPELANALTAFWAAEKAERKNRWDFQADLDEWIGRHLTNTAEYASYQTARELARVRIASTAYYKTLGWDKCDRFLRGGNWDYPELPADLAARWSDVRWRLFLEIDATPEPTSGDYFSISGDIVAAVMRSTGLSRASVETALSNGEATGEQCVARTALLKIVVALPRDRALPLLRRL